MNAAIELHDSTVAEIIKQDGTVTVEFRPAYLHQSEGRPGIDPGTGWVQDVQLIFSEASVDGNLPDLPCDVMDGEFVLSQKRQYLISVPLEAMGFVELQLIFDSIHAVTIKGKSVHLKLPGKPKYVEEVNLTSAG
jgi:hypothetical protein